MLERLLVAGDPVVVVPAIGILTARPIVGLLTGAFHGVVGQEKGRTDIAGTALSSG
ncbi:MAG: hypothetical protein ACT6TH_11070 [Brevundimonas sp.]|uniref:hypothetical protein n=1 Tax=Brevundimonas sp. TaxID=1871086 RepID=UPI0040343485